MVALSACQCVNTPTDDKFEPLNRKWSDWKARLFASELLTIVVIELVTPSISVRIDTLTSQTGEAE